MKAQTQIISVVLMTGIIISLVGTAYIWGKPLIEKQTTNTEFKSALRFVLDLDEKITDIANSGSGSYRMDIPKGTLKIIPYNANDPDNNSIIYTIPVTQPIIYDTDTLVLKTSSTDYVGIYGRTEPRIITVNIERTGNIYNLKFKIYYRELDSPSKGYQIALDAPNPVGSRTVTISFDKQEVKLHKANNGGDLVVNHIKLVQI